MIRRVQLVVTGMVQGVWFRASMQREARRLGLRGWVRNRADGALEAEAEGDSDAIAGLILWAQTGPSRQCEPGRTHCSMRHTQPGFATWTWHAPMVAPRNSSLSLSRHTTCLGR